MSKKKRLEAERAAAELAAREASAAKSAVRRPTISFKVMNNCAPVPVAKPADFIQLTPIVQPIPLVPYSSQLQPIAQFDEDSEF
jgi:hypothetical protein